MDFLVHHFLKTSATDFPQKEALICGGERLTFARTYERVLKLAHSLRKAGLKRGDRVGIYLESGIDQALAIFGILAAGGVFVPINSTLMREQVKHIVHDCQMVGFITTVEKFLQLNGTDKTFESFRFLVFDQKGSVQPSGNSSIFLSEIYDGTPIDFWDDWGVGFGFGWYPLYFWFYWEA